MTDRRKANGTDKANPAQPNPAQAIPTRASGERPRAGGEPGGSGVVLQAKPKTRKPSLYKVLLLNDDFTPMDFVIDVLQKFFHKSPEEATAIMLKVHTTGVGVCGVYTYEVAETKVSQVIDFGRQHQHPLQCTMEKE
mgnify:CR=1 FL=1